MHDPISMVLDPIWVLENRLGKCGQTNRVLLDGLETLGIKGRLVQLVAHIAAEVWLDGQWRFLDADWLDDGEVVRRPDGRIPSAREISSNPHWLDSLHPASEWSAYGVDLGYSPETFTDPVKRYKEMFVRTEVSGLTTPYYYVKTATAEQRQDVFFGWMNYETHDSH